jgi:hypothetical protein
MALICALKIRKKEEIMEGKKGMSNFFSKVFNSHQGRQESSRFLARRALFKIHSIVIAMILMLSFLPADLGDLIVWTIQFGTADWDNASGISVDESGMYVSGQTMGTLPGQTSAGDQDAYVRKYDHAGTEVWTRQIGTSELETPGGISVDSSGVYVAGTTGGAFPGQTSAGSIDAYVRKYDHAGTEIWTRQFGTATADYAYGISVDESGVYVAGETGGAFPGQTSAGSYDVFVRKYDHAGTEVWTRQFGTSESDLAIEISVDSSGVYVAGSTGGIFPGQTSAGFTDAFVRKYDHAGTEVWTLQFGTAAIDNAGGVSVDESGVYVVGSTRGTLPGQTSAGNGDKDAFVRKYDHAGTEVWTCQFGSSDNDGATGGVSVDGSGVYVAGFTDGTLPGQASAGSTDAFVAKLVHGLNQPPVAVCKDIEISADENCLATIVAEDVDGGSYDPDDHEITLSVDNLGPFGLGEHTVNLTVTDELGESDTCQAVVIVIDAMPPEISVTVSPDTLWPPNHKMVLITSTITVSDNCDLSPVTELTSITANEGDETNTYDPNYDSILGDGNTTNDIQVDESGNIYLRAERSGTGIDRIYTITYTVTDASGNSATATSTVTVPHDQKKP